MSVPVVRISLSNATVLSVFYLGIAIALEGVRRLFGFRWAERACLAMEAFPVRALELLGLMEPLKRAYAWDQLSPVQVRLLLGLTTVLLIFVLAMAVGGGMWAVSRVLGRRRS